MATLKELLELKEMYAKKADEANNAIKYYQEKISKEFNSEPRCKHVLRYGMCDKCKKEEQE